MTETQRNYDALSLSETRVPPQFQWINMAVHNFSYENGYLWVSPIFRQTHFDVGLE